MLKTLLITREFPPYAKGGMCRIVEHLVPSAKRNGIDLTIIANHPHLRISQESINGTNIYRVPSIGSTFVTQLPSFCLFSSHLIKKIQSEFDVIYSNFSPFCCKVSPPLIVGFHNTRDGQAKACLKTERPLHGLLNYLYTPFDTIMIKKADGLIVLTSNLASKLKTLGFVKGNIAIIPSGVDTNRFKPMQKVSPAPPKKVLFVGRLDATKGLDILLRAVKRVSSRINMELMIAGTGKEEKKLRQMVSSLSIPVDFLGMISQEKLPEIYNSADLFVLPSLFEGMPLVAFEAMACATPTLTSDACPDIGIPRFKGKDIGSLEEILIEYLTSDEKLKELSKISYQISQQFSWDKVADLTFKYIRQIHAQYKRSGQDLKRIGD